MEEIIFNVKTNTGNTVADLKKVTGSTEEIQKKAKTSSVELETMKGRANELRDSLISVSKGSKEFDKIQAELIELTKDIKAAEAGSALLGKRFDDIYGGIQPVTGRIGELEDRLYEMAAAGEKDSEVFKEISAEVTRLKNVVKEVDAVIDTTTTKGAGLQAALQLGSTVAAGYGALQGTMALVGGENEELEKSMQKLIAVQTVLSSVEAIRAGLQKESFLMLKAQTLWTNLQTAASNKLTIAEIAKNGIMGITTAVTGAATVAMGALNAVMMLNPVFLLIGGFAAIVGAIALFSSSADHAAEDNEKLNASIEKSNELMEISNERIIRMANNRLKQAQAEGASEEDLLKKRLSILKIEELARQRNLKAIENEAVERMKILRQATIEGDEETKKAAEDEIKNLKSKYLRLKAQDGQYYADKKAMITQFNREQREIEAKDAEASLNAQILQARGNFSQQQKLRKDLAKQERDNALRDVNLTESQKFLIQQQYEQKIADLNKDSADKAKAARDARLAKEKEAAQKRLELDRLISDLAVANITDEWQRKFTQLAIAQKREREDLIAKYGKNTELEKQLRMKQTAELMALDDEQRKEAEEKEKADAEKADQQQYADRKARRESDLIDLQIQSDKENEIIKQSLKDRLIMEMTEFEAEQEIQAELALLKRDQALKNKDLTEGEKLKISKEYDAKIAALDKQRVDREKANDEAIKQSRKDLYDSAVAYATQTFDLITGLSDALFGLEEQRASQATQQAENNVKYAEEQLAAAGNASAEEKARLQENVDAAKAAADAKQQQEEKLAKKKFDIDKKLQIAQAAIQGVQAVLAAYSSGSAIPVVGAVTGPLFAALAAATVVAQIAKIKNSTYQGSGSGSVSPPSQSTPNLNSLGSNSTTDTAALQNGSPGTGTPSGSLQPQIVLPIDSLKKVQDQSAQSQSIATIGG